VAVSCLTISAFNKTPPGMLSTRHSAFETLDEAQVVGRSGG
jgi:hypothetical protein